MNSLRLAATFVCIAALAACSSPNTNADTGPGNDAGRDTATDTRADTGHDIGTDVAIDTGADVVTDTGSDVVTGDTTADVPTADTGSDVVTSETGTDVVVVDVGTDVPVVDTGSDVVTDTGSPPVAWNAACTAASTCAAPTGDVGVCATAYGHPICVHSCNAQADWSLCEGGNGICVPIDSTTKVCVPKCGDTGDVACAAGQACAFVGYRDHTATDAGFAPVGACVPHCSATGADACTATGFACDVGTDTCAAVGCGTGCPSGSTCMGSSCVPTSPIPLYGSCTSTAAGTTNGCAGNQCYALGTGTPGFCGTPCTTADAVATCGTGGVCWTNVDQTVEAADGGTIGFPIGQFNIVGGRTDGICMRTCASATDCPSGFTCSEFDGVRACLPDLNARGTSTGGGTVLAGGLCRQNTDCASGHCQLFTGYLDGTCQRAATGVCPAGTVQDTVNTLVCHPVCDGMTDMQCEGSLNCDANSMTCLVGLCRDNRDCATGYLCDVNSGTCRTSPSTGAAVGGACTADSQCSGGFCIAQATADGGIVFPNGYCTASCTVLADLSDTCPAGSICGAAAEGVFGACVKLCDASPLVSRFGTCRAGYHCVAFTGDARYGYCDTN